MADEQIVVGDLLNDRRFDVIVTSTGRRYEVSEEEATELREVPDVFLSAGDRPQASFARIVIDAPREIPILRGDRYRGEGTGTEAQVQVARKRSF